jgi:glycerophosphoryl diester phosphodiesterase
LFTPERTKPYLESERPLNFGHRGSSAALPENTLEAFERAVQEGADGLEMDIHPSRSGEIVVIHDDAADRTTNGTGAVREMSLKDLKALDAGFRFTLDGGKTFPFRGKAVRIPTLEEVFKAFPESRINLEIKEPGDPMGRKLLELIERYGMEEKVLVAAEKGESIAAFRRLGSSVATGATALQVKRFFFTMKLGITPFYNPRADAFQIPEWYRDIHVVTPRFIRRAHGKGMKVHVWTVNDEVDMMRLLKWGVDGIMTDYPASLRTVISQFLKERTPQRGES